jgi:hypothetical protein
LADFDRLDFFNEADKNAAFGCKAFKEKHGVDSMCRKIVVVLLFG